MEGWKVPVMTPQEIAGLRESANEYWWLPGRQARQDDIREKLIILVEGQADGKGCRVRDAAGKEYLEFTASDWTASTGYGREEVAKVAYEQMMRIPHVDPFGNQKLAVSTIKFAEKLAQIAPGTLKKVFTISGGSEANEAAMKLTKQYQQKVGFPRRFKFISRRYNYHGATHGTLGLDGTPAGANRPYLMEPLAPGFLHVVHPYCYRCDFGLEYPSCDLLCAKQIEQTIQYEHPSTVAAVVMDTICPFARMAVPPPEYLPMVREICDRYGILWILDEVATGFGRTGKWFACEHWNVVPDIMTMDKQISGGWLPLSGVVVKEEIANKFIGTPEDALANGHTWWGHAVCLAVALRNIEIIEREHLVEHCAEMGTYFMNGLHAALDSSPIVGRIDGLGLMIGIEFVKDKKTREPVMGPPEAAVKFADRLVERGLLVHGSLLSSLILWPPMIVSKAEIDEALGILEKTVREAEKDIL